VRTRSSHSTAASVDEPGAWRPRPLRDRRFHSLGRRLQAAPGGAVWPQKPRRRRRDPSAMRPRLPSRQPAPRAARQSRPTSAGPEPARLSAAIDPRKSLERSRRLRRLMAISRSAGRLAGAPFAFGCGGRRAAEVCARRGGCEPLRRCRVSASRADGVWRRPYIAAGSPTRSSDPWFEARKTGRTEQRRHRAHVRPLDRGKGVRLAILG